MNLNDNAMKPLQGSPVSSRDLAQENHSRTRVEPCEFESLLQRAMEILNARARAATASSS
jgi:predicted kinase